MNPTHPTGARARWLRWTRSEILAVGATTAPVSSVVRLALGRDHLVGTSCDAGTVGGTEFALTGASIVPRCATFTNCPGLEPREHGAHRHGRALGHDQLANDAVLPDLDLDDALLRLDLRNDLAALDRVARLDAPLDQRARLHVRAQRGHREISHGP